MDANTKAIVQSYRDFIVAGNLETFKKLASDPIENICVSYEIRDMLYDGYGERPILTNNETFKDLFLTYAFRIGKLTVFKFLVDLKAKVRISDDYNFRWAVYHGNYDMVKYLIDTGANIYANNSEAFRDAKKHPKILDLLNLEKKQAKTALNILKDYFNVNESNKEIKISFYDHLHANKKSTYQDKDAVKAALDFVKNKPIEILVNICVDSINYYNEYYTHIEFASIILEVFHQQIHPQILRKYANVKYLDELKFDCMPNIKKNLPAWKQIKDETGPDIVQIVNLYHCMSMKFEEYMQKIEVKINFDNLLQLTDSSAKWIEKDATEWNMFVKICISNTYASDVVKFVKPHIESLDKENLEWLANQVKLNSAFATSDIANLISNTNKDRKIAELEARIERLELAYSSRSTNESST